jgi:ElaB/YqjD/DUF883 family membrane-anchored ribosome-binding protein
MNTEERGFQQVLENQEQIEQLEKVVRERGQEWLATAEEWVRENPYLAMGIAFAAGLTIAALITKRE